MRFAFSLCLELGIDDPVEWFRQCNPRTLDAWIAYKTIEWEEREKEKQPQLNRDPVSLFQQRFANFK